ncbi:MAG TPA: hypothetical protein VFF29_02530, partial [Bacteroidota bacterium]|nr:hypothetical protein [Bacteroidota bacterium]
RLIKGKTDLIKLIGAPVILPNVILLPISKGEKKVTPPLTDDSKLEIDRNHTELKRLTNAYEELRMIREITIENESEMQPPIQHQPINIEGDIATQRSFDLGKKVLTSPQNLSFNLRKEHFAGMSVPTKEVLDELGITEKTKYSKALSQIEARGQGLSLDIAKRTPSYSRKILIGTSLINLTDIQDQIIGPVPIDLSDTLICDYHFPFKIADLRIIEQELLDYVAGEIAHVENIMQGEMKDRGTRRSKMVENTFYSSSEREETNEKDTQTTERYTLEKEISKTVKEDKALELNGKVDMQYYGPVNVQASLSAGYSTSNSSEESTRNAISFAKDIVQRSAQKVIEKIKQEQTLKTIDEFEETNRHLLNNVSGQHHVVGVFRWLNKEYKVWLKNYGKRAIYELMIPEPAAYHLFAMTQKNDDSGITFMEPKMPSGLNSHKDITALNYHLWGALFNADLTPPPPQSIITSKGISHVSTAHTVSVGEVIIPQGYRALNAWVNFHGPNWQNSWGTVMFGLHEIFHGPNWTLNNESDTVKVTLWSFGAWSAAHIDVESVITPEFLETWKIKTYKAIIDAYEAKKATYDNAIAEAKANAGIVIRGNNPLYNTTIIETELKKNAIRLMTHCNPLHSSAMLDEGDFDCCQVMREAPYIKFVEQVFEWRNMVYEFYPYYWAEKNHWSNLYNLSDTDPLFQNFLKAGYARILVPVTPGFAQAAMNFVTLGTPHLNDLALMPVMDIINGLDEDAPTMKSARVSTQSNIDLTAPGPTIDGVTMVAGDRLLVRFQNLESENGVYIWQADMTPIPMIRANDADSNSELSLSIIAVTAGSDSGFMFKETEIIGQIGQDPVVYKIAAEVINESLLIPTELTILECQSAGIEPTKMKILGLCATPGIMASPPGDITPPHEH